MERMEQEMKIFKRLHRLCKEITNHGFVPTTTFNPKSMSFDFECRTILSGIKHAHMIRVDSDAPFFIYSDEEFDRWMQAFCSVLEGWIRTKKENT